MMRRLLFLLVLFSPLSSLRADETPSPERGKQALLGRAFTPGPWVPDAYERAWAQWQPLLKAAPDAEAVRAHYGLHPAPYDNGRLPMGLRQGQHVLIGKGLVSDCLLCHGGSVLGKSYIGLGNSSLDIQSLFEDLHKASGIPSKLPFTFCNVRGTSEAGTMAVYLLGRRDPDLSLRLQQPHKFPLRDTECMDVPAWWLLKKKKTMYHTGTSDARSVRAIMQFMLASTLGRSAFEKEEATFADIRAYLCSLEAPKYPFPIDPSLTGRGEKLFTRHCARCHGTYGPDWTYPNKVVPIDVIGTDRSRFDGIPREVGEHYNRSWFAQEKGDGYKVVEPVGYQAPPLDGIWATAPYFHNGSAPTLHDVLNSKARPRLFTRSYRTDAEAYDPVRVGWKVEVLPRGPDPTAPLHEQRKIYDTTRPGRGNGGHTFGDELTDEERRAVIEYLKTL